MPKFGSHIIFADTAAARRPDLFPNIHINALRFGAVGPDTTLFMFDPATNRPELRLGIETALNVLETVQDIKDKFNRIKDELTKPIDELTDFLSGGLTKDLSYTVEAGIEAMVLAVKLGIAFHAGNINVKNPIFDQLANLPKDFIKNPEHARQTWTIGTTDKFGFPFRLFGHPFTDDAGWKQPLPPGDYSEWWWMDMLHYRKTGTFASQLLADATTPLQRSYALGYMTHVAGDITGHPFINALVGGPFRSHAYRHLVLETLADTWLWDNQKRGDILDARLNQAIDLGDSEVREIADLIVQTMQKVYQPPMVPKLLKNGYPEPGEFVSAYRILKQYLRLSTGGSVHRPEPPPDSFEEVWDEIKDLLQASNPGPPPVWTGNLLDFLKALFKWFSKGLVLLTMIAALPAAVLTRIVTLAPRWLLYLLNLGIFHLISAIRTMLCLTGWGYAGAQDLQSFGFLNDLIRTKGGEFGLYPAKTMPSPKQPFYWLMPPSGDEDEPTVPLVPWRQGLMPDWMISPKNVMGDRQTLIDLCNAKTSAEAVKLARSLGVNGFGNAIDFAIALLEGSFPVPDIDLDGDRGYGFRGWEVLPPNEQFV